MTDLVSRGAAILAFSVLHGAIAACSTDGSAKPTSTGASTDDTGDSSSLDAGKKKTANDAGRTDSGASTTCDGACKQTTLSATFGAKSATLDKAYFGINLDGSLRVEVHGGGNVGCPTSSSAYDHTLVIPEIDLASLDVGAPTTIGATLLDFKGDLISSPSAKATSATIEPSIVDSASPTVFVEGAMSATFAAGTVSGHLYATHCDSLDETP